MLNRIFGVVGSGKREWMLDRMEEAFREGKRIFLLVPEQATADLEEEVCTRLGGKASMQVEITNFVYEILRGFKQAAPELTLSREEIFHIMCENASKLYNIKF